MRTVKLDLNHLCRNSVSDAHISMEFNPNTNTHRRWTIRAVLEWTTAYFKEKGIASSRLDAEILLAHALDCDRLHLYMNFEKPLTQPERDAYRNLVSRRAEREPVALITGKKEFWSIPLRVESGILIPRPDTETLVETILYEARQFSPPTILEIGTGSGAISIAIAQEKEDAYIVATDIDPHAARLASLNIHELKLSNRVWLVTADLFSAIRPKRQFDIICSNPPYIPKDKINDLEPEIVRFEPHKALNGGPDGLDVIRDISVQTKQYLADKGSLILEIGHNQEDSVRDILTQAGFANISTHPDLAGVARVVKAKW